MLKLGAAHRTKRTKKKAPKKAKRTHQNKAPSKAKRDDYTAPLPLGSKFRCSNCGEPHILVGPELTEHADPANYEDWRFYYCGRLRLAALEGYNFIDMTEA